MNKEIKPLLKKTARIAGVTCVAAGAVAIMTSATALKAIGEGGKYLVKTIRKIAAEDSDASCEEAAVQECGDAPCEEPAIQDCSDAPCEEPAIQDCSDAPCEEPAAPENN